MTRVERATRHTFRALSARNYRLYIARQVVSVSGTWMQTVAQAWLVLRLTGSGVALGVTTALQFLPMLVLGPWAGVIADRSDKRRLLLATQSAAGSLALVLGVLTATGAVQLWMVFLLALGLGLVNAFDMPARQSFVYEMVGPEHLTNAVGLNSTVMNAGRLVGPAVGGVVIATLGLATCFLLNALSYAAVLAALAAMRAGELHRTEPVARQHGQLLEGLRYVWVTPALRTPLLMLAVIGTLTYEFQVSLPILATFTFGAGAEGYGALLSAMSAGAVIGGLVLAGRMTPSHRGVGRAAAAFGLLVLLASGMPTLTTTAVVMPLVGAASIAVITLTNATLQLTADPQMRARVIALYGVAFLGSTPIGGPIVGWLGETLGARRARDRWARRAGLGVDRLAFAGARRHHDPG
ncbi:MFS transporter [Rhabdothermincola sediminis]|uniref:MFS transporter n=1 Tax=Rhabdothermincola sediminis TaxID=2751370 RepID=UPI001AA081FC|nr:MFS transporter [Rhabdothermincola sediminis]